MDGVPAMGVPRPIRRPSMRGETVPSSNPRYRKYHARVNLRRRVAKRGDPCAICGKPIDYSLPRGHPMAYELDEIVPISRGGSPTDPDNVQPTHAICNRKKGNKLIDERDAIDLGIPTSRDWWSE